MGEVEERGKGDEEDQGEYEGKEERRTGLEVGDVMGDKLNKVK